MLVEQEKEIIQTFLDLCKDKFNVDISTQNDKRIYNEVKQAFNLISNDRYPIMRLEQDLNKKRQDFEGIQRPYVRGESYGGEGGGAPINSFRVSYDENIHILRMEIEQELSDIAVQKTILEKQLKEEFSIFENLLILLPNQTQRQVLLMAYLDKRRYGDIANTLGYEYNTICQYVSNGIRDISKKIKQYRKI